MTMTPKTGKHANVLQMLAENNGAILSWQVSNAADFESAHADGAIGMDWAADCFVHPHALKLSDFGYTMFRGEDTGGGGYALVAETETNCFVLTDTSGCFAPDPKCAAMLGVYASREAWQLGDEVTSRDFYFRTIAEAVAFAQTICDGAQS